MEKILVLSEHKLPHKVIEEVDDSCLELNEMNYSEAVKVRWGKVSILVAINPTNLWIESKLCKKDAMAEFSGRLILVKESMDFKHLPSLINNFRHRVILDSIDSNELTNALNRYIIESIKIQTKNEFLMQ